MGKRCVIGGCGNTHRENVSLHLFPKDTKYKELWTDAVKIARKDWSGPSHETCICSVHFTADSVISPYQLSSQLGLKIGGTKRLRSDAVPSLFLKKIPRPVGEKRKVTKKSSTSWTLHLVKKAILSLKDPKGSSKSAIKKEIAARGAVASSKLINRALETGVKSGDLIQVDLDEDADSNGGNQQETEEKLIVFKCAKTQENENNEKQKIVEEMIDMEVWVIQDKEEEFRSIDSCEKQTEEEFHNSIDNRDQEKEELIVIEFGEKQTEGDTTSFEDGEAQGREDKLTNFDCWKKQEAEECLISADIGETQCKEEEEKVIVIECGEKQTDGHMRSCEDGDKVEMEDQSINVEHGDQEPKQVLYGEEQITKEDIKNFEDRAEGVSYDEWTYTEEMEQPEPDEDWTKFEDEEKQEIQGECTDIRGQEKQDLTRIECWIKQEPEEEFWNIENGEKQEMAEEWQNIVTQEEQERDWTKKRKAEDRNTIVKSGKKPRIEEDSTNIESLENQEREELSTNIEDGDGEEQEIEGERTNFDIHEKQKPEILISVQSWIKQEPEDECTAMEGGEQQEPLAESTNIEHGKECRGEGLTNFEDEKKEEFASIQGRDFAHDIVIKAEVDGAEFEQFGHPLESGKQLTDGSDAVRIREIAGATDLATEQMIVLQAGESGDEDFGGEEGETLAATSNADSEYQQTVSGFKRCSKCNGPISTADDDDITVHTEQPSDEGSQQCKTCLLNTTPGDTEKSGEKRYKCQYCEKSFVRPNYLQKHEKRHTAEKTFHCSHCEKAFITPFELKIHERTHAAQDERPYKCKYCQKGYTTPSILKTHELTHTSEKSHRCKYCKKTFSTVGYLRIHQKVHTGEGLYHCRYCRNKFTTQWGLRSHELRHLASDQRPFQCGQCMRGFTTLALLKQHEPSHLDEKPFKCEYCPKSFATKGYLTIHERMHTGVGLFKCKYCDKAYTTLANMQSHEITHAKEKPHQCQYCQKSFTTKGYLKIHVKIHTGQGLHKCEYCGKEFTTVTKVKLHERLHTGKKAFKCQYCKKGFADNRYLKLHEKFHEGERAYVCQFCGRACVTPGVLKQHEKRHTEEKPYKCGSCDESFFTPLRLKRHEEEHNGESHPCKYCDREFSTVDDRRSHEGTHIFIAFSDSKPIPV